MFKRAAGYIGPIGDDLPSLVPLIFALLIFFASFYSAHTIYRQTSANFSLTSNAMSIASFLKSDREIDDYAEFESICYGLNPRGYNFRAGIVDLNQPFEHIDIYAFVNEGKRIFSQDGNFFSCPLEIEQKLKLNSRVIVHMVPVSYKDNSALRKPITKPMLLVVVVWE
ncbi:MAG: hypothetical protein N3F05_04410 [Candidatus Diapherotrites archaeon]|nr:hypothetical protein [Candidatus Diapherotrites archaeon]